MAFETILSAYSEVVPLKQGGQKSVYRIRHPNFGQVVLKIGEAESSRGLERIRREVQTLREIDSPYYPKLLDFQMQTPWIFVIIEEYVEGRPLSQCITEFSGPQGALRLILEVSKGLDVLWTRRIVHRDVKPDNLIITPEGNPKILDLGIARLLDSESLTRTLNARGPCTPVYAAPEQLKNRKAQIDARSDQFALGILFVQLLLGGVHPFDPAIVGGDSTVQNILAGRWALGSVERLRLPESWTELAGRLLAIEPFGRFRSPGALIEALSALQV